jgi:hypothetical protein
LAAVFFTGAIDLEGAESARIAQDLLWGNGYVGITEEGTQLFFPPLFPFAIAGVSLLTEDAEIAGQRIISVTTGALVVVLTYFIATKMYVDTFGEQGSIISVIVQPTFRYGKAPTVRSR